MVSALGASWGSLGTFLAHLVGLLVALSVSLGVSWGLLGLLGRRFVSLGVSLGPSGDRLGGCWVPLGGGWRLLESLLACLVSFWVSWGFGRPLGIASTIRTGVLTLTLRGMDIVVLELHFQK